MLVKELDLGQGRDALIKEAYEAAFSLRAIDDYVELHYSTVSPDVAQPRPVPY